MITISVMITDMEANNLLKIAEMACIGAVPESSTPPERKPKTAP